MKIITICIIGIYILKINQVVFHKLGIFESDSPFE